MEKWKDINGFENYKISDKGNVFSKKTNTIMKPTPDKKGYLRISFYENGKNHTKKIHRLVAEAFIENHDNLPEVNHKNENKENNNVWNLEWCTKKYNILFGSALDRSHKANRNCKTTSVPVRCVNTNVIYPSIREAKRQTGATNIFYCCIGRRKTSNGLQWEYVEG